MKKFRSYRRQLWTRRAVALVLMLAVASGGYTMTKLSHAATGYNHSPVGFIDYCGLDSFSQTVLYGWAYDADSGANAFPKVQVSAGSASATVYTDVGSWNEGKINTWLRDNRPNTPITGEYGFAATMGQLYKGVSYSVSGLAQNVDAGSDTNLNYNTGSGGDGITGGSLLTYSRTLPDACLGLTQPATPPPADNDMQVCDLQTKQVVTIKESQYKSNPSRYATDTSKCSTGGTQPPPTGGGGGGGSGGGSTTHTTAASHPASTSPGAPANNADGTAQIGTAAAQITVPAHGASTVSLFYGTDAQNLTTATDSVTVSGDSAVIKLTGLQAKSNYFYQIVRTDSAKRVSTSGNTSFTTSGYVVSLHFKNNSNKDISGIEGIIDDEATTQAKSGNNGVMSFSDLTDGTYTVSYEYKGLNYARHFDTTDASSDQANNPEPITLSAEVNVDALRDGSKNPLVKAKHHSVWPVILVILFFIILVTAVVYFILRRRSSGVYGSTDAYTYGSPLEPTQITPPPAAMVQPNEPELEHVGESLRDMVVRSMHQQAQKRKNDDSDDQK